MKKPTVLLVDDQPGILLAMSRLLKSQPYNIITAESAREALETMSVTNVVVLITDHAMPEMTGNELLKIVKEKYPDTTRIMITGRTDVGVAIDAVHDGDVFAFITKPWDNAHLLRTIASAVEEHPEYSGQLGMKRIADKMQKLDEMKKNFACTAMHELRTPLTCIMGCAEMIKEISKNCKTDCRNLCRYLMRSAKRLDMLVDNMQEMIENGHDRPVCAAPFSMNDLVREVENDVRAILKARKQRLNVNLADNLPPCLGEAKKMWQAVSNLVINAIRFTPDGGTITVETKYEDGKVQLVVSDTGIGIPEDEQEVIFEPFYEVNSTSHHSSGTIEFMSGSMGLGLTIVKSVVDRHGGSIYVNSVVGEGSTFVVELPTGKMAFNPQPKPTRLVSGSSNS